MSDIKGDGIPTHDPEIQGAAIKANNMLGEVLNPRPNDLVGYVKSFFRKRNHLLSDPDLGNKILDTYEKAESSDIDSLTNLLNRKGFEDVLYKGIAESRRAGGDAVLAILDFDNFKEINDGLGHPGGDETLRVVAGLLKVFARDSDSVGRWGGDEFALYLPHTTIDNAQSMSERYRVELGEKLRERLKEKYPNQINDERIYGLSSGFVSLSEVAKTFIEEGRVTNLEEFNNSKELTSEEICKRMVKIADERLYSHKGTKENNKKVNNG